jgi:hypothetical protein
MNISHNKYDAIESVIFNQGLKIISLNFDYNFGKMHVVLNNKLAFVVSVKSYERLKDATPSSLQHYRLVGNGAGIHWPDLDEDLSLKGFFTAYLQQKINTEKELVIS